MPDIMFPNAGAAFAQGQMDQLKIQGMLQDLAMQPYKQQMMQAEAQTMQASAQQKQLEMRQQKMVMQLQQQRMQDYAQGKPVQPLDQAQQLDALAQDYFKVGLIDQGAKLAENASLIRQRVSSAENQQSEIQKRQFEMQQGMLTQANNMLSQVYDQASLDQANAQFQQMTGRPSPLAGKQYSPELIDNATKYLVDAKTRLESTYKEKQLARQEQRNAVQDAVDQSRKALYDTRRERIMQGPAPKVAGVHPVSAPSTAERKDALNMVKEVYPNIDKKSGETAAYYIAAEAKKLRRDNPALDAAQATAQAMRNAQARKEFTDIVRRESDTFLGMKISGTTKDVHTLGFKPGGVQAGNATWSKLPPEGQQQAIAALQSATGPRREQLKKYFKDTYGFLPPGIK